MKHGLKEFYELVDDEWENRMRDNPLFATRTGDHRYNDLLMRIGESDYKRRLTKVNEFISRLSEIDSAEFPKLDKLNFILFKEFLENARSSYQFRTYRMSLSKENGFYLSYPQLYLLTPLKSEEDYFKFIMRLNAMPKDVDDQIEIMQHGLENEQTQPRIAMDGVVETISKQITEDPIQSPYYDAFKEFPNSFTIEVVSQLRVEGKQAISDSIFPALRKFSEFLKNNYIPNLREEIAISSIPNGREYYQHLIKYFTTVDLAAHEIHKIGSEEVSRIRAEMESILLQTDFKGTIQEFIQFLRDDPRFYVNNPESLLEKTSLVLKRMDGQLPKLFKTLPRLPYGIREIPEYAAPTSTTAYYQPGTGDGTKSGTYYVNTYDLKSRPLFEIEALSLHEAVPGHHLQISLQMELDLPNFRRFGYFTVFTEGWGLYSEHLGLETGFYTDPYSNFGRLSYEMWRACRLVVDTGIHALGWSRQKAIDFMAEYTSLSILNITNEVDRYISWPGQALAYKLGEIKFRELRRKAEKELGALFDVREFHDCVLVNGSLPLNILESQVSKWIKDYIQADL